MALAYLLDPVADAFERIGMNRMWATVSVLMLFVLIFFLMLVVIVPTLAHQNGRICGEFPDLSGVATEVDFEHERRHLAALPVGL